MDLEPLDLSSITVSTIDNPKKMWPTEVRDFVPWLKENLGLLGAELGMDLTFVGTEVPVGSLREDLVATDGAGRRVIVEAQFGPSDHKHLGQLVTYACIDRAADVLVWVVVGFPPQRRHLLSEEHQVTLCRLNEIHAGLHVFRAVEVTLGSQEWAMSELPDDFGPLRPRFDVEV